MQRYRPLPQRRAEDEATDTYGAKFWLSTLKMVIVIMSIVCGYVWAHHYFNWPSGAPLVNKYTPQQTVPAPSNN